MRDMPVAERCKCQWIEYISEGLPEIVVGLDGLAHVIVAGSYDSNSMRYML